MIEEEQENKVPNFNDLSLRPFPIQKIIRKLFKKKNTEEVNLNNSPESYGQVFKFYEAYKTFHPKMVALIKSAKARKAKEGRAFRYTAEEIKTVFDLSIFYVYMESLVRLCDHMRCDGVDWDYMGNLMRTMFFEVGWIFENTYKELNRPLYNLIWKTDEEFLELYEGVIYPEDLMGFDCPVRWVPGGWIYSFE